MNYSIPVMSIKQRFDLKAIVLNDLKQIKVCSYQRGIIIDPRHLTAFFINNGIKVDDSGFLKFNYYVFGFSIY